MPVYLDPPTRAIMAALADAAGSGRLLRDQLDCERASLGHEIVADMVGRVRAVVDRDHDQAAELVGEPLAVAVP